MKLYTEDQVRKAIELARDTHREGKPYLERDEYDYSIDEVVDLLTPIELPSDEDIVKDSKYKSLAGSGWIEGAKWMRDKMEGSNG